MKLVTVAEMRAIEQEANARGVSYEEMMDRAGQGVADVVQSFEWEEYPPVVIGLVGSGNNGGDALVALAALAEEGWQARAYLARPRASGDPLVKRLLDSGGEVLRVEDDVDFKLLDAWMRSATVLLDGVLGTGIQLPLKPELARLLGRVSSFSPMPFVVAIDCPSGVDANSGEMASETIPADVTVTMEAVKTGLLLFPAFENVGALEVVELGLPEDLESVKLVRRQVVTENFVSEHLPARPMDAHKGTFGTAVIVAGSVNYTGAAFLAAKAAYLAGAGLVRAAVPSPLHPALAGRLPEVTWLLLPHEMGVISAKAWDVLSKNLDKVTALLFGPGFGMEETTSNFVDRMVANQSSHTPRPAIGFVTAPRAVEKAVAASLPSMVVDADGLKLLAKIKNWPKALPPETILTPHPGEMSVLTGLDTGEIQADRNAIAQRFAQEWGHVVVLKGAMTVIASPDGRLAVVPVATPALARAGTGDVLAGIITGLRAQGMEAFEAAACGAWIHAQAGLEALERVGHPASVLAGDVLDSIPDVLWRLAN